MYPYHPSQQYHMEDDERQNFNLPGYIGGQMVGYLGNQLFGPPRPPYQPGPPFSPGGHFPGQGPGYPGGPGQNQMDAPPNVPPPSFTPTQNQFQTFAIDPGSIRGCLYQFTYVWLKRDAFWFYPTYIGRRSVSGYRWNGYRWVYYGVDLNRIESFQCY